MSNDLGGVFNPFVVEQCDDPTGIRTLGLTGAYVVDTRNDVILAAGLDRAQAEAQAARLWEQEQQAEEARHE